MIIENREQHKILVTGGTGFLGAYIIKNLIKKRIAVKSIIHNKNLPFFIDKEILDNVEWIQGDLLDLISLEEAVRDVTGIIHAAALVSFDSRDKHLLTQVNVEGTENLVNAALQAGVPRFIHVSSVGALSKNKNGDILKENNEWNADERHSHYAVTKHLAEMQVWRAFSEGLETVIINPSTILGYGNWNQSSCAVFKSVYNQFPWYTDGINGFVGVEDVAEATVRLLFSKHSGKKYIISSENYSFKQLFDQIAEGFHKKKPKKKAGKILGSLVWRAEWLKSRLTGKKSLLTKETAQSALAKNKYDGSAILDALPGFSYTPLDEVIEEACKEYLEKLKDHLTTKQ